MKKILLYILAIIIILIIAILGINTYVKISTKKQIITDNEYSSIKDIDCIIILGAGIWGDKPSPMLEDRLNEGIALVETMEEKSTTK